MCPHLGCQHSYLRTSVTPCPECNDGSLVLDPLRWVSLSLIQFLLPPEVTLLSRNQPVTLFSVADTMWLEYDVAVTLQLLKGNQGDLVLGAHMRFPSQHAAKESPHLQYSLSAVPANHEDGNDLEFTKQSTELSRSCSAPKWRLDCNKCIFLIYLPENLHAARVSKDKLAQKFAFGAGCGPQPLTSLPGHQQSGLTAAPQGLEPAQTDPVPTEP
jgi:hypothetical protein